MKANNTIRLIFALAIGLMLTASCKQSSGEKILPSISGKAGEVAVVCSRGDWEAEPGNAIRDIMAQECPYLPQVEPLYTLFNVPTQSFNKIFEVHRNIIWLNIGEQYQEAKMVLNNDVWAAPQTVVRFEAKDQNALVCECRLVGDPHKVRCDFLYAVAGGEAGRPAGELLDLPADGKVLEFA